MATQLNATLRAGGGKGDARATRRNGLVPAVIYGNNESPLLIALDTNKVTPVIYRGGFLSHTMELIVDGPNGNTVHRVLPRDVQLHPVSDQPWHIDFLRVTDKTEIRVEVPVTFKNQLTAPGIKAGGTLNVVAHAIGFYAQAGAIPESLEIDVGAMEIGDAIHLNDITLPRGLRLINQDEAGMTVVTVGAATVEAEAAPVEAAPAAAAAPAKGGKAAPAAAAPAAAAPAKKK